MNGRSRALSVLSDCLRFDGELDTPPRYWPSKEGWHGVIELANDYLLGPTLFERLRHRHWLAGVPSEVQEYMALLHRMNQARNRALAAQAEETVKALNNGGIEPMILKGGIVLFESPYPYRSRSSRMMRDLDIMVRKEDREQAVSILTSIGYRVLSRFPDNHHAVAEFTREGDPGAVDLHTELVDPHYVLPAEEVWQRAVLLKTKGACLRAPAPTDRMMHHLLHAQVHYLADFYRAEMHLNQIYEFTVMAIRYANQMEWSQIERRIELHHLKTPLQSYLLCAQRLFGLAWPLAGSPSLAARLHYRRCRLQILWPALHAIAAPWGNLRGAFAWHRMHASYGDRGWLPVWQLRHAWHFIKQNPVRQILARVFRIP